MLSALLVVLIFGVVFIGEHALVFRQSQRLIGPVAQSRNLRLPSLSYAWWVYVFKVIPA